MVGESLANLESPGDGILSTGCDVESQVTAQTIF